MYYFRPVAPCASPPPPRPSIFLIILFLSTTLLKGMTSISFHKQWPLTSQSRGSFLKENKWSFFMDQTPRPHPTNRFLGSVGPRNCRGRYLASLQVGSFIHGCLFCDQVGNFKPKSHQI
jgi:hypothetical protein